MKEIVLKLYEFDELSKDSQERIIERERWNVMEQCMDAYDIDYKKSMEAFEDLTDTKVYGWEVGYERYDFSYEFKYKDPIYEHPTDYHRDIFPENLCGKLLFRYINNNIMPHITKGKYYSTGKYIDGKYNYKCRRSRVILGYEDNCPLTGMCYDYYLLKPIIDYYDTWCTYPDDFVVQYQLVQRYFLLDIICLMMAAWLLSLVDWSLSKRLSRNTRRSEQACLIGMFGEYLEV